MKLIEIDFYQRYIIFVFVKTDGNTIHENFLIVVVVYRVINVEILTTIEISRNKHHCFLTLYTVCIF